MAWQKRARFAVAVFGIVCAGVVYAALGQRRTAAPPAPVERLDPKAIAESKDGRLRQLRESDEDFDVTFERQLTYENGRSKSFGVRIAAKERGGDRDFQVKADEAEAGDNQQVLQLAGHVRLDASDGFMLATDRASFTQVDGIVHSDGKVTFGKARMSGYGSNTTYNQKSDVLAIAKDAHVEMRNERDALALNFDAGAATLDRMQDLLTLDGMVHVIREHQVIEADHAVAHLDTEDQFITLLELRGNARVQGTGGGLDAMSARDIDLHYTPDGKTLERVILNGGSAIALTGENGAPGRTVTGESVETQLAADGSVTHVTAQDAKSVRLALPAAEGTPARSITSRTLDATGAPGKGLTNARFVDAVEFREEAQKDTPTRTVRARTLDAALTSSSVSDAVFSGAVRFDEQNLSASAAELRYAPDEGTLKLSGSDSGGGPHVADERIAIDAQRIDVTLQGRHMTASPAVKTTLMPEGAKAAGKGATSSSNSEPNRLPGLLKQDKPASVNAAALEYDGAAGKATYTGAVTLWQGDTSLRADTITIDQQKGDLVATGNAVLRLSLENGESVGQAHEIRYDDERHLVTYLSPPPSTSRGTSTPPRAAQAGRAGAAPTRPSQPHLNGPQGDLSADRLELFLAEDGSALDRLEAYDRVTTTVDAGTPTRRTATGARLTYRAANEEYQMVGTATAPVRVAESCRETTGKTLTFYKSADRIIVDGKNEIRTETKSSGSCSSAPPAPTRP